MQLKQLKEVSASSVKTKLEYHSTLCPDLWDDLKLKPEIRTHLLKIVDAFFEEVDYKVKIQDVIILGSACNYNYSKVSDIDLHVIVENKEDTIEYKYLAAEREAWKDKHDIKVFEFKIELYIQASDEVVTKNAAIFSLTNDKWVREPVKENPPPNMDDPKIKEDAAKIMTEIDNAIKSKKVTVDTLLKIKKKLKELRKSGLKKGGEYDVNNLVYKTVRNNGYIEKLFDHIYKLEDESLSYHEKKSVNESVKNCLENYTGPYTGDFCPTCDETAVMGCRCQINDRRCANGHQWHRVDGKVVMGSGHGKNSF